MFSILPSLLFAVSVFFPIIVHAADRELAADGSKVHLTISNTYRCNPDAAIKITASSADYFDTDALTIQRLADTARAVLSFECPRISRINFTGYTGEAVVFKASAQKNTRWALETEPAPLEGFALFFSLYDPQFYYLGIVNEQLGPYRNIKGINETYQFKAYEKQVNRLIKIVNGDTEKFRSYLINPEGEFGSFEKLLAHYADILTTIEIYAPDHYAAYRKVYADVSDSLKNDYWSARMGKIVENEKKTVGEIVSDATELATTSSSAEVLTFVDDYVANWLIEETNFIKADLAEAPLYEIAWASEYVAGFPDATQAKPLPKTNSLIQKLSEELVPLLEQRTGELQSLAVNTIQEAGTSYTDVDTILETGFALAEEFEEAGYVAEGQALIAATITHIDNVLKSGLQNYKNELISLELTGETVAALQEQALMFDELSAEFEGFAAYKEAVANILNVNKSAICEGILKDAGVNPSEYKKRISLGSSQVSLSTLACDLFENQHVITEFGLAGKSGTYTLGIDKADGTRNRFRLKAGNLHGQDLRIQARIENKERPMNEKEWQKYIAQLLLPPPDGTPDVNGVRECDKLAADPYDPNKLAPGIDFEKKKIDPDMFDRAIDACIAAVENEPGDARQQFQLGRLLWYAGDQEAASEYIKLASTSNYAPALYYNAEMLLASDDKDAFIDALDMFKASGKNGYAPGSAMVKELNPDGIDFFKEIPAPTGRDIAESLSNKGASQSIFGITTSVRVVDAEVRECFQTSATDFSCEYRKILKCGMSGGGNDPIFNLMNAAIQADCKGTEYTFGSFRKIDDKKWKELPTS